ncbi:MAG: hypothetical protein P1U42_02845 [Phycisphaerales bacterium]|nr:hypothetical protein [Phycisphaerales bacterium]
MSLKLIQIWKFLILGILIPSTGCQSSNQSRLTLGGSYLSPSFCPQQNSEQSRASDSSELLSEIVTPRNQWEPTQYITPFDGVTHRSNFIVSAPLKKKDRPRRYGRYPTTEDVLTAQDTSWMNDLMISIDELGRSLIGTPYFITIRLLELKATDPVLSPIFPWKRSDYSSWSSGHPSEAPSEPNQIEDHQHDDTQ